MQNRICISGNFSSQGVAMLRLSSLVIALAAWLCFTAPAQAGKLLFWRFDAAQNRLNFNTDSRVQPTAQLIPNPTRIVIDLPGTTLGRPTVNQPIGGAIVSLRVAQFDPFTTRLVIEMAPGYTVDPQQVKVRGITPSQWTVELPTPQRISDSPAPPPPYSPQSRNSAPPRPAIAAPGHEAVQVTPNGLFIRLNRNGDNSRISIDRNRDAQTIAFALPGAELPQNLLGQTVAINQYGVKSIQFAAIDNTPQLNLSVNSPGQSWQAYYSRLGGGIILLPKNNNRVVQEITPPQSGTSRPLPPALPRATYPFRGATITQVDITRDYRQLLIRANQTIQARGNFNRLSGEYEIRIDNAQVAQGLRGPQLENSPLYQVRIRQEPGNQVLILVQPSSGTTFGRFFRSGGDLFALEITAGRNLANRPRPGLAISSLPSTPQPPHEGIPIRVDPPRNTSSWPTQPSLQPNYPFNTPSQAPPRVPRSGRMVMIDPGHGGKDPGAIGINGVQEKDVILPISQYLAQYLEQQGVRAVLTRNSDYFVSLQGRTDMANRAGADLFVSIHANSMGAGRPDVSGLEVYYFGNSALSSAIHRSIIRSVNVKDRGVRKARFYVLRNSRMPSTLVEVGFVTGYEDVNNLVNPNYQQQMARAIAQGIIDYLQRN
jgi:N-acetylmuramoyl-L-alanine amidase